MLCLQTIAVLSIILSLCVIYGEAMSSLRRLGKHGALGLPRVNHIRKRLQASRIPAKWFEQKKDHFNPQSTETWQQVSGTMFSSQHPTSSPSSQMLCELHS